MPCYRCSARQADPVRGASPWKRGVIDGAQVLVCPQCQRDHDWTADLDRCASCGSTALVRSLGSIRCRACGAVSSGGEPAGPASGAGGSLRDEVASALERVLRPTREDPPSPPP